MQHLLVKEKLDFQCFRRTNFYSYGTRTSQLDSVPPTILGAAHQLNMHLIALAILLITNRGLLLWQVFPNTEELNSNDFSGNVIAELVTRCP